jgi:DNA primase
MEMTEWLEEALQGCSLTEDAVDYLMGRGATPDTIERWGVRTFECPSTQCPDEALVKRYGPHFEVFRDKVIYPLRSGRGELLGFDSRSLGRKDELRFLLAESVWHAVWIGLPDAMDGVWEGRDILVVEGRYDVFAMNHVFQGPVLGSGPAHLSWKQVEWLRRWARGRVFLAYDRDAAGKLGTEKGLEQLRRVKVPCAEMAYGRQGDDPGLIYDRGGVAELRAQFPYL